MNSNWKGSRRIAQAAWRRDPGEFLAAVECSLASIRIMPYDRAAGVRFATAAVAIRPHSAAAHHLLGYSLWLHDDYSGAIEAYRTAIRRNPGSFASRNNLAISLSALGRFQEAVPAAQELAVVAGRAGRTDEEEAWRRTASEWAALGARIDKVLAGEEKAGSARDALVAASLADRKGLHRAATRLMQEALRLEKEPIGLRADLYYEAACSAAQAGAGRGDDDDGDEAERLRYVRLAIELLRKDLRVRRASEDARIALTAERRSLLASWIEDEDLAGIRDAVALTRLPEAERKACLALWTEVTSLIDTLER